jgi:hypothetical protein
LLENANDEDDIVEPKVLLIRFRHEQPQTDWAAYQNLNNRPSADGELQRALGCTGDMVKEGTVDRQRVDRANLEDNAGTVLRHCLKLFERAVVMEMALPHSETVIFPLRTKPPKNGHSH